MLHSPQNASVNRLSQPVQGQRQLSPDPRPRLLMLRWEINAASSQSRLKKASCPIALIPKPKRWKSLRRQHQTGFSRTAIYNAPLFRENVDHASTRLRRCCHSFLNRSGRFRRSSQSDAAIAVYLCLIHQYCIPSVIKRNYMV
jgi:hypothetical protein